MKRAFLHFYFFIIISLLVIQFAVNPIIGSIVSVSMREQMIRYNRELSRGAFHMMEENLLSLPLSSWEERVAELQQYFGYQITLTHHELLDLPSGLKKQLAAGEIAVVDDGDRLYHRVGESDMVLGKGPFTPLSPGSNFVLLTSVWGIIITALAFFTLLWIIPYWRKLQQLTTTAAAFGEGNFDVRAKVSPRSLFYPIGHAFNIMADRIGQLITSHQELTNAVSHELRTPLARLQFGLEMVEGADGAGERQRYLGGVRNDIRELEELVAELLTYSRFERETPALRFSPHDIVRLVVDIVEENRPLERDIVIDVQTHLSTEVHPRLEPKYFSRALQNVVQNAMKYTATRVELRGERQGEYCLIHVDDDGPGITPADRERIFAPFTRLDSSRSRSSGGYGLGLAIVARIMQWHGGDVRVGESPLGGARFTLSWPGFTDEMR